MQPGLRLCRGHDAEFARAGVAAAVHQVDHAHRTAVVRCDFDPAFVVDLSAELRRGSADLQAAEYIQCNILFYKQHAVVCKFIYRVLRNRLRDAHRPREIDVDPVDDMRLRFRDPALRRIQFSSAVCFIVQVQIALLTEADMRFHIRCPAVHGHACAAAAVEIQHGVIVCKQNSLLVKVAAPHFDRAADFREFASHAAENRELHARRHLQLRSPEVHMHVLRDGQTLSERKADQSSQVEIAFAVRDGGLQVLEDDVRVDIFAGEHPCAGAGCPAHCPKPDRLAGRHFQTAGVAAVVPHAVVAHEVNVIDIIVHRETVQSGILCRVGSRGKADHRDAALIHCGKHAESILYLDGAGSALIIMDVDIDLLTGLCPAAQEKGLAAAAEAV